MTGGKLETNAHAIVSPFGNYRFQPVMKKQAVAQDRTARHGGPGMAIEARSGRDVRPARI
jgi:hypothetical protein